MMKNDASMVRNLGASRKSQRMMIKKRWVMHEFKRALATQMRKRCDWGDATSKMIEFCQYEWAEIAKLVVRLTSLDAACRAVQCKWRDIDCDAEVAIYAMLRRRWLQTECCWDEIAKRVAHLASLDVASTRQLQYQEAIAVIDVTRLRIQ